MRTWAERHQVLAVSLFAGVLYVLWQLNAVVVVALLGYIVCAAMLPAVDWLARYVPRVVSILILYVATVGVLIGFLIWAALPIAGQAGAVSERLSATVAQLQQSAPWLGTINAAEVAQYLRAHIFVLTSSVFAAVAGVVSSLIISMYLLYDWHAIRPRVVGRGIGMGAFLDASQQSLGAWVRGQLLLSLVVGVLATLALFVLGVPYALVLGVFAGICELIPYIGPFIAGAPAVVVALGDSPTRAVLAVVSYVLIQQVENHALVPLVMKRSTNLHPVVVILVLLVGFELLGIVGALVAVPTAVLVRTAATTLWHA